MKRFVAWLMVFATLVMMMPAFADEEVTALSGKCGSNLKYELTKTGDKNQYGNDTYKLSITGSGKMYDYKLDYISGEITTPWFGYDIRKIELPSGLTSIGDYAFCYVGNGDVDVTIPEKVTSIGASAFEATALGEVVIPKSVKTIENYAFAFDDNYGDLYAVYVYSDDVKYGSRVFVNAGRMGGIPYIYGHKGSTTETYCKNNGLHFEELQATPVEKIELDKTEVSLEKGKSVKISATVLPANADNKKLKWTSADKSVAKVKNGTITGVAGGETVITVTARDGSGVKAEVKVTVTGVMPSSIRLNRKTSSINQGKSVKLSATVSPSNADDRSVTWTSSDTAVAKVNKKGKVRAVAPGTCTITATTVNGLTATCTITVKPQLVTKVALNKRSAEIKIKAGQELGKKLTLKATVSPEKATNPVLKWTSSDEKIATVDQNGVVTSVGYGKCKITATATDGSRKSAYCYVTVKKNYVTKIKLTGEKTMIAGTTQQLATEIKPPKAYDRTVTWTSSNSAVATVDENGLVTAVKAGYATITCKANDGSGKYTRISIKVTAN